LTQEIIDGTITNAEAVAVMRRFRRGRVGWDRPVLRGDAPVVMVIVVMKMEQASVMGVDGLR